MKSVDPFAPTAPLENTLVPELGLVSKTSRVEAGKFDALLAKAHGVEAQAKTPANSNAKALPGTQLTLPDAGKPEKASRVDTQIQLPAQGRSIHESITRTTRALPEREAAPALELETPETPQVQQTAKKGETAKLEDTDTLALRFDDDEVEDQGRLQAVLSQVATVVARIVVPKGDKPATEQLVKGTATAAKSVALPAVQAEVAPDGHAFSTALDTQVESDDAILSPSTNIDGTDEHTVAAQAATSSVPPGHSLPPLTASEAASLPGLAGRTRAAGMTARHTGPTQSADAQVTSSASDKGRVLPAQKVQDVAVSSNKLPLGAAPVAAAPVQKGAVPSASAPVAPAPAMKPPTMAAPSAPVASAPAASAPVASAPVASAPVASAPVASAPVASAPVASAPVASARVASGPAASAPAVRGAPAQAAAPRARVAAEVAPIATAPAQGVATASTAAAPAPQVELVVKGTPLPEGATPDAQVPMRADRKSEAGSEPMDRIHGFTRGALAGSAFSAYSGRAQTADKEGGTSENRADVEEELEDLETQADSKAELDKLIAAPEQAAAAQMQPTMVEAQRLDLPVPVPAVPVPQAPLQTPEVEFAARPPGSQTEAASISIHHPDLGPIQLEVHRDHGRVEVHAVLESVHAEAVLRANESGIRQGVQQSGMSFSALRVRVRGEEQPTARPAQSMRKRRANSEK